MWKLISVLYIYMLLPKAESIFKLLTFTMRSSGVVGVSILYNWCNVVKRVI
jgi:hypothetical protein